MARKKRLRKPKLSSGAIKGLHEGECTSIAPGKLACKLGGKVRVRAGST